MQKIDVQSLGNVYNIIDDEHKPVKTIRIIKQEDLLTSALGEYNEEFYTSYTEYMEKSISRLHNFVKNPYKVLWHACTEVEFDIIEIVDICVEHGYDFVLLEIYIPETEDIYLS